MPRAGITGVDLAAVDGINVNLVPPILSEFGTDMSRFPSVKQFAPWFGLVPRNDISGGKVLRSRTLKTGNRVSLGLDQAMVAIVHCISRTIYFMLQHKVPYQDLSAEHYEVQRQQREMASLKRRVLI